VQADDPNKTSDANEMDANEIDANETDGALKRRMEFSLMGICVSDSRVDSAIVFLRDARRAPVGPERRW
jgi:hypothetical protein